MFSDSVTVPTALPNPKTSSSACQRGQGPKSEESASTVLVPVWFPADCSRALDAAITRLRNNGKGHPVGALPAGGPPGWHRLGVDFGYARPEWCERPQRFVHTGTGETYVKRCGSARSSRCAPCAELKRGDVAAIARSGWMDHPTDFGFFVTLTPPGKTVLPWDTERCSHSAGVPCAGDIGCVVQADALARWHYGLGLRWSHFITDIRRVLARRWPSVDVQFHKTYEPHKRGPMHVHSMMRAAGAPVTLRAFKAAVRLCAVRNGFGPVFDVQAVRLDDPRAIARTAGYVAKYSTKSADSLPQTLRIAPDGTPSHGGLRAWSASRQWGDTMRAVQTRRCDYFQRQRVSPTESGCPGGEAALDLYSSIYAQPLGPPVVVPLIAG